ncbi:MAG: enoyl-CoA hydratase/carnithine racemase [Pseudomonadales bacterium]|jgi:enoyl-CoA hydratase/carnithine racemase
MNTMELTIENGVHLLTLTNGDNENKLNLDVVNEYHKNLDKVESYEGNTAFVLTCDHDKTFSTGIDLEWLMGIGVTQAEEFVVQLENLMLRVGLLNMATIVGLNGNCYAGGAIFATAFDFKFMRSDRGRFCYPEVNINIPFTDVMSAIIQLNPNKHVLKEMALIGTAFTGAECAEHQIVDGIFVQQELRAKTLAFAESMTSKDRTTYGAIKAGLRPSLVAFKQQRKL